MYNSQRDEYFEQPFKKKYTEAFILVIDNLLESDEELKEEQADE